VFETLGLDIYELYIHIGRNECGVGQQAKMFMLYVYDLWFTSLALFPPVESVKTERWEQEA